MSQVASLLTVLGAVVLLLGGSVVLTYWVLVVVRLVTRSREDRVQAGAQRAFAIVIPAHNEESGLAGTLRSCRDLDYPRDRVDVYVVADNCSDRTPEVAQEHGVHCLVRDDTIRTGKGYALKFAFARLDLSRYDAVMVLDADCVLNPEALRTFDRYLGDGHEALQGRYVTSNPDDSVISYVAAVGNALENDLFYAPLARMGGNVLLRGTGMVFRTSVLHQCSWDAFGATEDVEYSLTLARCGVRVRFVEGVSVRSAFPRDWSQLDVQRRRWAGGDLGLAKRSGLRLVGEGLWRRSRLLVEAGWTLMLLSRPLVVLLVTAPVLLALAASRLSPGSAADRLLLAGLGILLPLLAYFLIGVLRLGVTPRRVRLLLRAPIVVARLTVISIAALLGHSSAGWLRTPR